MMTTEMKDYLELFMPSGTYSVKASEAEIKQFLLLCKQAERNRSYQLAEYLCWLAQHNHTVERAAVIKVNGTIYLGVHYTLNGVFSQEYFPICKAGDRPAAWGKFIDDEELSDEELCELFTTTPRYMWEPWESYFRREGVNWEYKVEETEQKWDESVIDEDGFILEYRVGIYKDGKKVLTDSEEYEFRDGIGGTWFQEVK